MSEDNEEVKNFLIAGNLKRNDWVKRKGELEIGGAHDAWTGVFNDFLRKRLETRYLEPIDTILGVAKNQRGVSSINEGEIPAKNVGEGFSIVTIQCALIEFLAALKKGINFNDEAPVCKFEYYKSGPVFFDFLQKEEPFNKWFSNEKKAKDFYKNVRCGLMHEAGTKGGWRIRASCDVGSVGIDTEKKIVFRDALQVAIEKYICAYGVLLQTDRDIQAAFIRKFNHLADVKDACVCCKCQKPE